MYVGNTNITVPVDFFIENELADAFTIWASTSITEFFHQLRPMIIYPKCNGTGIVWLILKTGLPERTVTAPISSYLQSDLGTMHATPPSSLSTFRQQRDRNRKNFATWALTHCNLSLRNSVAPLSIQSYAFPRSPTHSHPHTRRAVLPCQINYLRTVPAAAFFTLALINFTLL